MSADKPTDAFGSRVMESEATANSRERWRQQAPKIATVSVLAPLLAFLVIGIVTMEVPSGAEAPGPKVFPIMVAILTGVLLVVQLVTLGRAPKATMKADPAPAGKVAPSQPPGTHAANDINGVGLIGAVGSFFVFTLLLEPIGWLISAALLFVGIAWSIGARNVLTILAGGLAIASIVQLAFGGGLGMALPAGILEGLF